MTTLQDGNKLKQNNELQQNKSSGKRSLKHVFNTGRFRRNKKNTAAKLKHELSAISEGEEEEEEEDDDLQGARFILQYL